MGKIRRVYAQYAIRISVKKKCGETQIQFVHEGGIGAYIRNKKTQFPNSLWSWRLVQIEKKERN